MLPISIADHLVKTMAENLPRLHSYFVRRRPIPVAKMASSDFLRPNVTVSRMYIDK
jgi:hypothetical protein